MKEDQMAICNFCTQSVKTYRCKVLGMQNVFHACRKCIRTNPLQLIPLEEFNEDQSESQGGERLSLDNRTEQLPSS